MFERFTDEARRAMALSNREAQRLGHEYIGPEHLLLGLVADPGVGIEVLRALGVEPAAVRSEVMRRLPAGAGAAIAAAAPAVGRAKNVIVEAIHEARRLGDSHVGTGHLLLGLLGVPGTVA